MIIDESQGRDAIHLAVENVVAAEKLFPGQHIGFVDGGVGATASELVGIVDPFLSGPVYPGQRFWLVVYPRKITSLRHVWEHPAFPSADATKPVEDETPVLLFEAIVNPPTPPEQSSEEWLRGYAASIRESYDDLMEAARDWVDSMNSPNSWGAYYSKEKFEGEYLPEEFWEHYQNVTGEVLADYQKGSFFTCSC
jgi:hypothetical protein